MIFGVFSLINLPIGAGYDEETHLVRAWQMSNLDLLPNKVIEAQTPFPKIYWDLSYRRQELVRPIETGFWEKYGGLTIDSQEYVYGVTTRSVYSPLLLFPQALVLRYAGRSLNLPALPVFYLTRLAGLLSYLVLVWFSVRITPYGKWVFAILSLSPMAILQAVTISADTISNGIAFLFIAGTLSISQKEKIGWRECWSIIFLSFLLFAAKVNLVFLILLPLLLLPLLNFKKKSIYVFLIIAIVSLFIIEVLGWSIIAYPRLGTAPDGTNPVGQIKFIIENLTFFIKTLFIDIFKYAGLRFRNWVALYGYDYWPVPQITYSFYIGALILSLFLENDRERKATSKERIIFFILFFIGYISTITLMYLSFTPVGSSVVIGVQGRYFTVVMPLLFLALAPKRHLEQKMRSWFQRAFLIFSGLSLLTYILGLWLSYQVPCGSQYYKSGLCFQPNYKNFSPETIYSPPLSADLALTQEIAPECDGMTSARVWVNTEQSSAENSVQFFVFRENGKLLSDETVLVSDLPLSGWHTLRFEPEWDSSTRMYDLIIQSEDKNISDGVRIAYSIRPEYPNGKLYENEKSTEQDIIFQYGCIAGWEKRQYKPQQ